MSDKKISQLTAATTPLAGTEVLPIVQGTTTVKVANNDLRPKQIQSNATSGVLQVTGPAAASTRVMTTPDANFTAARTDAAQTFTGNQRIDGNVGIGTAPRSYVSGSETIDMGAWVGIGGTNASVSFNAYYDGTNWKRKLPYGVGCTLYSGSDQVHRFYYAPASTADSTINWSTAFYTDSNGDINAAGNIKMLTSGKGIDFSVTSEGSGTMTSELLADYEEGTWTPAYGCDGGNPTVTYTVQQGKYVKIGNMVYVSCGLVINTTSGGSGALRIYGLPYAAGSDIVAGLSNAFVWSFATNPQQYNISAGLDSILLYTSTFTNTVATAASLQNGAYLYISGCYRTN